MEKFRFVTPSRAGKWYGDLKLAQQTANAIGAGFLIAGAVSSWLILVQSWKLQIAPSSPQWMVGAVPTFSTGLCRSSSALVGA
jgi:hypothetical protein